MPRRTWEVGIRRLRRGAAAAAAAPEVRYDPAYDVPFAGLADVRRALRQAGFGEGMGQAQAILDSGQSVGQWLDAQLGAAPNPMPFSADGVPSGDNNFRRNLSASWGNRAFAGTGNSARWRWVWAAHQLWALGPIFTTERGSVPYTWHANRLYQLFDGTIRDVLYHTMYDLFFGEFLNLADNRGDNGSGVDIVPNQNYVRELYQLFSLGQWMLNDDGTVRLDAQGHRIPAYTLADIRGGADMTSGFRVNERPYATWEMEHPPSTAGHNLHRRNAKSFFGLHIRAPGGAPTRQYVRTGVDLLLNYLGNHEQTLRYVALWFIRHLVTPAPSGAYVRRVLAALRDDGRGLRGSLRAMYRAIILDPEARGNDKPAGFGIAQDWFLATAALCRAGGQEWIATESPVSRLSYEGFETTSGWQSGAGSNGVNKQSGVEAGYVPSVFSYFPFDAEATRLWTTSAIISAWGSWVGSAVAHVPGGSWLDADGRRYGRWELGAFTAGAPSNATLIERAVELLCCGRTLPPAARAALVTMLDELAAQVSKFSGAGTVALQCRAAVALCAVAHMPEAMEVG